MQESCRASETHKIRKKGGQSEWDEKLLEIGISRGRNGQKEKIIEDCLYENCSVKKRAFTLCWTLLI